MNIFSVKFHLRTKFSKIINSLLPDLKLYKFLRSNRTYLDGNINYISFYSAFCHRLPFLFFHRNFDFYSKRFLDLLSLISSIFLSFRIGTLSKFRFSSDRKLETVKGGYGIFRKPTYSYVAGFSSLNDIGSRAERFSLFSYSRQPRAGSLKAKLFPFNWYHLSPARARDVMP